MSLLLVYEILYLIVLITVCLRILFDTRNNSKSLAFILFAIFVPIIGIFFYFTFGINYRKRVIYSKKLLHNDAFADRLHHELFEYSRQIFSEKRSAVKNFKGLASFLARGSHSALAAHNSVKLLVNGENKFPEVLRALRKAKHHIHIEYYIYEDDTIGRAIEEILIQKAQEGVAVRFIYDDLGSRKIRKKLVGRLKSHGVEVFPFLKVRLLAIASKVNYRNHRKIIIVDGLTAFVGGINVSDEYINDAANPGKLFWRDTHLLIRGPGVRYLQYIFLCDWNFCASDKAEPDKNFFPDKKSLRIAENTIVQIAASGPDSKNPTIAFSFLQAIALAKKEILITTPYFIPTESLQNALIVAALSGVSVKMLVPGKSDSVLVNKAASSYYAELLNAGVEIYLYKKGFVHAKTFVADSMLAIVGTANMDSRSFNLNFEVNALVYDTKIATELAQIFKTDIKNADQLNAAVWAERSRTKQFFEKTARLISPLL